MTRVGWRTMGNKVAMLYINCCDALLCMFSTMSGIDDQGGECWN
jgi:hypothetical protein